MMRLPGFTAENLLGSTRAGCPTFRGFGGAAAEVWHASDQPLVIRATKLPARVLGTRG